MCCGYNFLTRMYDEWVFSTSLCCCAYVVQRQTWIWPISVRYAWFLATPSWFSLIYKLWSLNNKLPLYQKMKEPKLTHIRTEHMIKNKLEKIIKARLQKNTQLVVTGECKTCLYCTWNHLPRNKKLPGNKYLRLKNLKRKVGLVTYHQMCLQPVYETR